MRKTYWSCTKFADWLRGKPKLCAGTSREWRDWEKESKAAHPFRYWLAEEGLDAIQNFIFWPIDQLYSAKYWINNRFVTKTHAMTSNLKRGEWHEYETRLLHCMFDELVNFVEVEQAWWHIAWDPEARVKYKPPFYAFGWFRSRTWRCPEAGIEALQWASKLTDLEWLPEEEKHKAKPTHQAKTAKEVLKLYHWWKEVRPTRPDPHDASGWTDWCDRRRETSDHFLDMEDNEEDRKETTKILDLCREIEENCEKEDEKMMIRLIKIRRGLWT